MVSMVTSTQLVASPSGGISPSVGPTIENIIFDPTFYALSVMMTVFLLSAAILGLKARKKLTDEKQRNRALGTSLAALGFATTIIAAVSLLALTRVALLGGFLYLQAEFGVGYLGSAMIMYGIDTTVFSESETVSQVRSMGRQSKLRAVIWISFIVSVSVSVAYLFNPATYTITYSGTVQHVAQQGVFWLPPFLTFLIGITSVPSVAVASRDVGVRRHAIWFAFFVALVIVGFLKESAIIPSLGDPFVDMLVAFVPFTAGGFCLLLSAASLRRFKPVPLR